MAIYQLGVLGTPTAAFFTSLTETISRLVADFGLIVGTDISIALKENFRPDPKLVSAATYFCNGSGDTPEITNLLNVGIPIVPVVSKISAFSKEAPPALQHINGLDLSDKDPALTRLAVVLLEAVGLLPRQRRLFLSYRRSESREAALQLFEAFSARHFDVFLDTHGVPPAEDFQAVLWHRLCESDVLVMLDTPSYFEGRWTAAEFGRALAKSAGILRLGWPGHMQSPQTSLAYSMQLDAPDLTEASRLTDRVIELACREVEVLRSKSIAARHLKIVSDLRVGAVLLGGSVEGVGSHRAVAVRLLDGRLITAFPAIGVPSAETLHEAAMHSKDGTTAVVYDQVGIHERWRKHLDWLGVCIPAPRFIRSNESAWSLADWPRVD